MERNDGRPGTLLLVRFIGASLAAGGIGGVVTTKNVRTWYRALARPRWTPPDWLFGPVWTVLYFCIGTAGWLATRRGDAALIRLWRLQFTANAVWAPLFFGLHRPAIALADIVLLWSAIAAFVARARRTTPRSALLFTPYLLWVSYAAALNAAVWWMNRKRAEFR